MPFRYSRHWFCCPKDMTCVNLHSIYVGEWALSLMSYLRVAASVSALNKIPHFKTFYMASGAAIYDDLGWSPKMPVEWAILGVYCGQQEMWESWTYKWPLPFHFWTIVIYLFPTDLPDRSCMPSELSLFYTFCKDKYARK